MTYRKANASEIEKRDVFNKGDQIPGLDASWWRKDTCGATMFYSDHGDRESDYGWEIDHIVAVANGGSDLLSNKQPLHWRNNVAKGDKIKWYCAVTQ